MAPGDRAVLGCSSNWGTSRSMRRDNLYFNEYNLHENHAILCYTKPGKIILHDIKSKGSNRPRGECYRNGHELQDGHEELESGDVITLKRLAFRGGDEVTLLFTITEHAPSKPLNAPKTLSPAPAKQRLACHDTSTPATVHHHRAPQHPRPGKADTLATPTPVPVSPKKSNIEEESQIRVGRIDQILYKIRDQINIARIYRFDAVLSRIKRQIEITKQPIRPPPVRPYAVPAANQPIRLPPIHSCAVPVSRVIPPKLVADQTERTLPSGMFPIAKGGRLPNSSPEFLGRFFELWSTLCILGFSAYT